MDRDAIVAAVRLISLVESTNVSAAEMVTIVQQSHLEIEAKYLWPWLETTANFGTTLNTQTTALPTAFGRMIALWDSVTDTGEIPYLTSREFFDRFTDRTTGSQTAQYYTIFAGSIYFWPVPNATDVDAYEIMYYAQPTVLSVATSTPAWDRQYHWIVVEAALTRLYQREEMPEMARAAEFRRDEMLDDMVRYYFHQGPIPRIWGDGLPSKYIENIPGLIA